MTAPQWGSAMAVRHVDKRAEQTGGNQPLPKTRGIEPQPRQKTTQNQQGRPKAKNINHEQQAKNPKKGKTGTENWADDKTRQATVKHGQRQAKTRPAQARIKQERQRQKTSTSNRQKIPKRAKQAHNRHKTEN